MSKNTILQPKYVPSNECVHYVLVILFLQFLNSFEEIFLSLIVVNSFTVVITMYLKFFVQLIKVVHKFDIDF